MKKILILVISLLSNNIIDAQIKILFDATKAETAGNADWVIDSDLHNIGYGNGPAVVGSGNEANPQRFPTPAQSGITSSTPETYWTGSLSAWGVDCVKKGYVVETLPYNVAITYGNNSNVQDLSNYKVFIIDEPNIVFTAAEKTAIMLFVQNGGGLFMISDHCVSDRNNDGWDSPQIWNNLMASNSVQTNPFGITFDSANFSETSTNIPNLPNDSLLHGQMGNVTEMKWSNGTSMTLNTAHNSTVKGVVYKTGSTFGSTGVMVAYARFGAGKVVAMGDSSPPDDGTGDPNDVLYNGWTLDANGNHERLIMNATIWLATTNGCTPVTAGATATTICAGTSVTLTGSGAASYTWSGGVTNGVAFVPTTTITYSVTGTGGNGCTNTATKTITVNTIDKSVSVSNATLIANAIPATYQWINCNNGKTLIAGQTNQSFTAIANGNYAVVITQNGCSDTSACKSITSTGIVEDVLAAALNIYPNPTNGRVTINIIDKSDHVTIEVYNDLGQLVYNEKTNECTGECNKIIDMNSFKKGIYLFRIYANENVFTKKILLIK